MIGETISHYRITDKLGEGGMGVVYKAEDTKLERTVALKFLAGHLLNDEEAKQRFLREAKSAAGLHHANVCPVYEIDEVDGKTFLAMAFLEGETLEDRIAKGPLPLKDALDIGRQAAEGLAAAHAAGVVHRDIKPANVLVSPEGRATIMDFGLARLTEASKLTKADQTVGTAAYMSPEQAQGMEVDSRSDIWALGVVLYEMVRGQRPFQGEYDQALLFEIVHQEPEPLTGVRTGVPPELELLVTKCLAKDAQDRYGHADEIAKDLRTLAEKLRSGRSTILKTTAEPIAVQHVAPSDSTPAAASPTIKLRLYQCLFAVTAIGFAALAFPHFTQEPTSPETSLRKFSFTPKSLYSSAHYPRASVSPDGRWIAYVSGDEPSELWLRSMESEQPRKLDGTEGVQHSPFWSPDSRFVGFAAEGELKKVAVSGETPVVLCQIPTGNWSGGAWSPDGARIIFTGGRPVKLHEVSAIGGRFRLFLEPLEGDRGSDNFSPHFLPPDAARPSLLFDVGSMTDRDIYLLEIETGEPVKLAEGSRPFYSPTGHVLYQPRPFVGGIWALPFSLETLQPTGEAFPVAEHVGGPSLAVDGTLVTVDVSGGEGQRLVWRDRRGRRTDEIGRPQENIENPAVSPDGRLVAVYGLEHPGDPGDIWLHEAGRTLSRRLTSNAARDAFPVWSPDGQELAFQTERQGNGDLFLRGISGESEAVELTESPDRDAGADFSPDGRSLVFGRRKPQGWDLWLLKRDAAGKVLETKEFLATPFSEYRPQISPDGRYVAYCSDESGVIEVYVHDFPAGERRWPVSVRGGGQPRWSPDGTELFYVEGDTLVAAKVSTNPEFRIGEIEYLFPDPSLFGIAWDYDVSADGRFVMVEDVVPEGEPRRKPSIHVTQNWYEEFRDHGED